MTRLPIVVMYHHIWPDDEPAPRGIRPLLAREFNRQIDWLQQRYKIVGAEEFLETYRLANAQAPCLLTFDDGTRDHAEVATPILVSRGLSGVVFVLSGPPKNGLMPLTHALHWLLGNDPEAAWLAFELYARQRLGGVDALGSAAEAQRLYHYEEPLRARIKYAANMALPGQHTQIIVENVIRDRGKTMSELAGEWFASSAQIQQMHESGMTIGMHGVTHRSLQALGAAGIRQELRQCAGFLSDILGGKPRWWACPFGGSGAPAGTVAAMNHTLQELGVEAAVSTAARPVSPQTPPLSLPRFDSANLPPRAPAPAEVE
jgi:peptidoglycan/xylan/chitin deacetylase (PgdA/CDA1 family)